MNVVRRNLIPTAIVWLPFRVRHSGRRTAVLRRTDGPSGEPAPDRHGASPRRRQVRLDGSGNEALSPEVGDGADHDTGPLGRRLGSVAPLILEAHRDGCGTGLARVRVQIAGTSAVTRDAELDRRVGFDVRALIDGMRHRE